MDKYFLDFERPEEIYKQIQALEIVSKENPDLQAQIDLLSKKYQERKKTLLKSFFLGKGYGCQHPERPHTSDFIKLIFDEFDELHGDKTLEMIPLLLVGNFRKYSYDNWSREGRHSRKTQRNFGMPQPEGYRKV